jgi:hypothetical protein
MAGLKKEGRRRDKGGGWRGKEIVNLEDTLEQTGEAVSSVLSQRWEAGLGL